MKYGWLPAGGVFVWNNYKTRDKVEQKQQVSHLF